MAARNLLLGCRPLRGLRVAMPAQEEPVAGPEGGETGVAGEKGEEEVKSAECAVSREENRGETAVCWALLLVFAVTLISSERRFPGRLGNIFFLQCGAGFIH